MSKYILEVKLDEDFPEDLKIHYLNYNCNSQDSGIDLIIPENIYPKISQVTTIDHKICCQMIRQESDNTERYVSYWLLPRSSISKTNFRMANSVGLIDSGYRGNIMAKIDTIPISINGEYTKIEPSTRLFQIATGDLTPISEVRVVSELSKTERGSGGFGSTG